MSNRQPSDANRRFFMRYAGLATQLLAAIALSVFLGLKADKAWNTKPLLSVLLPLIVLSALFYKLFKETNTTKK
ncbi:MAG: AtpZ/AtpI family protein [Chitinophagaceae bacterium]|nr:AtpZ/AtpI family protein [Chitinophagaceae bacterium]